MFPLINELYEEDEQIKEWVDFVADKVIEKIIMDYNKSGIFYQILKKRIKEENYVNRWDN